MNAVSSNSPAQDRIGPARARARAGASGTGTPRTGARATTSTASCSGNTRQETNSTPS
ncbi:hypothetical protein ACFY00_24845 [Kitasatospora sp. NPDC001540]|uniref:hypothetical protein n=1 Tax=Kitasatospora sp. NPDC001540 TaxID=3364014 RepID=UPI00368975B5